MSYGEERTRAQAALCLCVSVALTILLAATLAQGASRPKYGGALRIVFADRADSYDPALANNLPEQLIAHSVYETATVLDSDGEPRGWLLTGWQKEAEGRRWLIQVRGNARFHSGTAVTAPAVAAALDRAVSRARTAAAGVLRNAKFSCTSPAPGRLLCEAAQPVDSLPRLLADPSLAISDGDGAGTGAFQVVSWVRGSRVRLEAFEGHPRGRPFLDSLEMEFGADARRQRVEFELRRADVIVPAATESRLSGNLLAAPPGNLLMLGFGGGGPMAAVEVRRALATHLDREALARLLPPGRADAAWSFLPEWLSGYEFVFAGTPAPAGGLPRGAFRLIHDAGDSVATLIASRLVLDLRPMGLDVRVEGLAGEAFRQARQSGQADLFLESVRLPTRSGDALANVLQLTGAEVSAAALQAPGGESRLAAEYEAERSAMERMLAIPLLHYRDEYRTQGGAEQVKLDTGGLLDLANAWRK